MENMSREEKKIKVIEVLNIARGMELYAIHQYMNQHYSLDNMDYGDFASKLKLIAIDEMRHAENFAERIKKLGGEPTSTPDKPIVKNQTVEQIFAFNSMTETNTMESYNEFLNICRHCGDSISAKLFETIIEEEQVHDDYFSDTDEHIKSLGDTYLSKIAGTPASTGLAPSGYVVSKGGTD